MNTESKKKIVKLLVLLACLCVSIAFTAMLVRSASGSDTKEPFEQLSEQTGDYVEYNGAVYRPKELLETLLVIGLDKYQVDPQKNGYLNDQQSDFLLLLVMDHNKQICQTLQLNRDTMTEIQRLGVAGGEAGSFTGQLSLAHTYGSGGSDSCINTTKAVSKLLDGAPINHYYAVTMDAVAVMNDLVGGVTVLINDDFSNVDASLVQGTEIRLLGEQALTYVRARGGMDDSSNIKRMERQQQYMAALYDALQARVAEDGDFLRTALMKISPYVKSDCSVNRLETLGQQLETYTIVPVDAIAGEAVQGDEFMEFYVDEDSLRETILTLFYEKE